MTNTVYIDTETTGLSASDEIVEIAIVDDERVLLNTLVRPVRMKNWGEAQAIHGISPDDVKDSPTYDDIRGAVADLVKDNRVVIYNAAYDSMFLDTELEGAASVECAMEDFAELYGQWNDYHQSYTWQKLTTAAAYVCHEWEGEAHRALADTQATRSVWKYLTDPEEQKRVNRIKKDIAAAREKEARKRAAIREEDWKNREALFLFQEIAKKLVEPKKKVWNSVRRAIQRWLDPSCYPRIAPDKKESEDKEFFYYRLFTGYQKTVAINLAKAKDEGIEVFEGGIIPKGYTTKEQSGREIPGSITRHGLLISKRKTFTTSLYKIRKIQHCPRLYEGWSSVPSELATETALKRYKVPKKIRCSLKVVGWVNTRYMNRKHKTYALYKVPVEYRKTASTREAENA